MIILLPNQFYSSPFYFNSLSGMTFSIKKWDFIDFIVLGAEYLQGLQGGVGFRVGNLSSDIVPLHVEIKTL